MPPFSAKFAKNETNLMEMFMNVYFDYKFQITENVHLQD